MKLLFNRGQTTNPKGTVLFKVILKLEASSHEIQLINTYSNITRVIGNVGDYCTGGQVKSFISTGISFESDNLGRMLVVEKKVQEDIEQLNSFIKTAESYQGNEEIEFK